MEIRVAIVDDKVVNRKTIRDKLRNADGIRVVLEAVNGEDFLERMKATPQAELPQVVLMDLDMPVMNGIDAICIGSMKFAALKFLVLTVFDDDENIFEAIQAGASGYLLKEDNATRLAEAIVQVQEMEGAPMSPAIARKALSLLKTSSRAGAPAEPSVLTEREQEILRLMVEGLEYKEIASRLFISPWTVRTHVSNIYEKLHVSSKAQAIRLAHQKRWV
jgi:DNA-binding NarL/FixJ family response regulator